jgi:hypothetical protein
MNDPTSRASLRFGWTAVAGFLLLGLVLESFHLWKAPFYLEHRLRRELWTLAHAHGTLLGALNVLFALTALACLPDEKARRRAGAALRAGGLLVPLGFLLGGIGNSEGDPSPFILLVPAGAVLAFLGVGALARGAWRMGQAPRERPSRESQGP